jgi:hypothetical protein
MGETCAYCGEPITADSVQHWGFWFCSADHAEDWYYDGAELSEYA